MSLGLLGVVGQKKIKRNKQMEKQTHKHAGSSPEVCPGSLAEHFTGTVV